MEVMLEEELEAGGCWQMVNVLLAADI